MCIAYVSSDNVCNDGKKTLPTPFPLTNKPRLCFSPWLEGMEVLAHIETKLSQQQCKEVLYDINRTLSSHLFKDTDTEARWVLH